MLHYYLHDFWEPSNNMSGAESFAFWHLSSLICLLQKYHENLNAHNITVYA